MASEQKVLARRHLITMVALFFFLTSIYLLVYNGEVRFNDELQMLDITGSFVEYQDAKYDVSLWYVWTNYEPLGQDQSRVYPLPESPVEPLQSLSGVPFYVFARLIPHIGLAHAVWLVNVLVCAAVCVLLFQYIRLLGYDARVALVAGLLLGLCTVLLPYSKTFLREPLATFFMLLTAFFLELARTRRWLYLGAAGIAFALAYLTKESSVMGIPALLLIALPVSVRRNVKRWSDVALICGITLTLVMIFTNLVPSIIPEPIPLYGIYSLQTAYFRTALHSYLLSIGGSIWGTSPILLLALPGGWMLLRRGRRRYVWMMVVNLLGFAIGHAISTGSYWSGGATLPSRFLMPTIPYMLLVSLPVLDTVLPTKGVLHRSLESVGAQDVPSLQRALGWVRHNLHRLLLIVLIVYSLWWQLNSILFSWYDYFRALPEESSGLAEWGPSLNTLRYMRPTVLTGLWFQAPLDFAWAKSGHFAWAVGLAVLAGLLGFALWCIVYRDGRSLRIVGTRNPISPNRVVMASPVLFTLLAASALYSIYWDDAYLGRRDALHKVSRILDSEEQPGDILLLSSPQYHWFFLNYRAFDDVRVVSLPLAPGERGSCEETPRVISDNLVDLLQEPTADLIYALAARRNRLWVLMDTGPFLPCSVRPLERFLNEAFYPIREVPTVPPDPTVRLLEYSTVRANISPTEETVWVETDLTFGGGIRLRGVKLPVGDRYRVGEVVPITLFWDTVELVPNEYTVALFLARSDGVVFLNGQVVQGWDSPPSAGFAPTSRWEVGELIHDNRALRLPDQLASGEYRLVVRLYRIDATGQVETLPIVGTGVIGEDLGTLPVRIQVLP